MCKIKLPNFSFLAGDGEMLHDFLVFVLVMFLGSVCLWVLSVALSPRNPHPVKEDTYECGLEAPKPIVASVNFQYYFYAIIFIALDTAVVFFILFACGGGNPNGAVPLLLFAVLLVLPLTYIMLGGRNDSKIL